MLFVLNDNVIIITFRSGFNLLYGHRKIILQFTARLIFVVDLSEPKAPRQNEGHVFLTQRWRCIFKVYMVEICIYLSRPNSLTSCIPQGTTHTWVT